MAGREVLPEVIDQDVFGGEPKKGVGPSIIGRCKCPEENDSECTGDCAPCRWFVVRKVASAVGQDVMEIVWAVRRKDRTRADLRRCGCEKCQRALGVLKEATDE